MLYHAKSTVRANVTRTPRTFRPHIENLECRTQPGSVLPFNEFSMIGHDLFDRDPLTGRRSGHTSDQGLVAIAAPAPDAGAFSPLVTRQVQLVQPSQDQPAASAPTEVRAHDLALAAGVILANGVESNVAAPALGKGIDFSAPVVTQMPYQVRPAQAEVVMPLTAQPLTGLQVQPTTNEGPSVTADPPDFTSFIGSPGNDVGYSVAVDGKSFSYYAGYTERNGNRDMLFWKMDPSGTFKVWETVIDDSYGYSVGDDEALSINTCNNAIVLCATGYVTSSNGDTDLILLKLDAGNGTLALTPVIVATPGNDRGIDVKHNFDHSTAYVTGTVDNGLLFSGAFNTYDLEVVYANAYGIPGDSNLVGTGIAVTPLDPTGRQQDSILVGTSDNGSFFAKIDSTGNPIYAGMVADPNVKFNGVDIQQSGGDTFFYITGEKAAATPTPHTLMLLGKFQDLGANFAQVWGFFGHTYTFSGVLGHLAGNDIRVDAAGYSYVICELWAPGVNRNTGDNDAHIFKADPTGTTRTDYYHYGDANFPAPDNDKGFGIAMNLAFGPPNTVWTTGKTSSPDFPVTPSAFQTWHADGDNVTSDAFSSSVNLPL